MRRAVRDHGPCVHCRRPARCKGLCHACYQYKWRTGRLPPRRGADPEAFGIAPREAYENAVGFEARMRWRRWMEQVPLRDAALETAGRNP